MNEVSRRELETIPCDRTFDNVPCHATGYEVLFEGDPVWWSEYTDSEGNLYYGN